MDAQDKQRLNELEFTIQGLKQKVEDLQKLMNQMNPQRDTSESPRPQRSTEKFAGSRF